MSQFRMAAHVDSVDGGADSSLELQQAAEPEGALRLTMDVMGEGEAASITVDSDALSEALDAVRGVRRRGPRKAKDADAS